MSLLFLRDKDTLAGLFGKWETYVRFAAQQTAAPRRSLTRRYFVDLTGKIEGLDFAGLDLPFMASPANQWGLWYSVTIEGFQSPDEVAVITREGWREACPDEAGVNSGRIVSDTSVALPKGTDMRGAVTFYNAIACDSAALQAAVEAIVYDLDRQFAAKLPFSV